MLYDNVLKLNECIINIIMYYCMMIYHLRPPRDLFHRKNAPQNHDLLQHTCIITQYLYTKHTSM